MTTRRELEVAALLVRLEKLASLGTATTALGRGASKALGGGVLGAAAHGAVKVAPYAATGYAANQALGDPVGKQIQLQKSRLRARMKDRRAVYDPRTGVMY